MSFVVLLRVSMLILPGRLVVYDRGHTSVSRQRRVGHYSCPWAGQHFQKFSKHHPRPGATRCFLTVPVEHRYSRPHSTREALDVRPRDPSGEPVSVRQPLCHRQPGNNAGFLPTTGIVHPDKPMADSWRVSAALTVWARPITTTARTHGILHTLRVCSPILVINPSSHLSSSPPPRR